MQGVKKSEGEKGIGIFLAFHQIIPGVSSYFRERRNNLRAIIHYENFNISSTGGSFSSSTLEVGSCSASA